MGSEISGRYASGSVSCRLCALARCSANAMTRSIAETAEHLGVSTKTVRRWIAEGRLKAVRLIRVDTASVEALMKQIGNA